MRQLAQQGFTTITKAEATITENAATVAEQGAHVVRRRTSSKDDAQKKGAPQGAREPPRAAKPRPRRRKPRPERSHTKEASTPRAERAKILELIRRPKGATLAEIQQATDWQAHSVRGFLSTAAKKHGLKIESTKTESGDRVYQIRK